MEYTEFELEYARNQRSRLEDIMYSSVMELEDEIRKTIKDRWKRGESVSGGNITNKKTGSGYSQLSYKALKLMINPSAGGNVDLTYTGILGDKIELIKNGNGDYEIISTDSKYEEIGDKYGFDEIGLSPNEMQYFMKKLEDKLNLKL